MCLKSVLIAPWHYLYVTCWTTFRYWLFIRNAIYSDTVTGSRCIYFVIRYFTAVPHLGGSKESFEQAKYLADELRKFGFDKVELKKYTALLSVPRSPGNVTMFEQDGTVAFHSTVLEKPLHKSEGDPREVYPFNAYTASGQAEVCMHFAFCFLPKSCKNLLNSFIYL